MPLSDGTDALRTARPEVGTARPGGRVPCRNGLVTDVTHADVAETAACGRARRRIGNGTFNVSGTDGYDPGHDFGHARGNPANLPLVPDLPAFAAHTAHDLNGAARQRARRPCGLPLMHRPAPSPPPSPTSPSRRSPQTTIPIPFKENCCRS